VINDLGAAHEAGAEHAIVAVLEFAIEANEIARVVGAVGHDDRHRLATKFGKAAADGKSETIGRSVVQVAQAWIGGAERGEYALGAVAAVVVDDEDLVADFRRL